MYLLLRFSKILEHWEPSTSSGKNNTPTKKRKYRNELSEGEKQTVFKRKFHPDWKNEEEYKGKAVIKLN